MKYLGLVMVLLCGCSNGPMDTRYKEEAVKVTRCIEAGGTPYNDGVNDWILGACMKTVPLPDTTKEGGK